MYIKIYTINFVTINFDLIINLFIYINYKFINHQTDHSKLNKVKNHLKWLKKNNTNKWTKTWTCKFYISWIISFLSNPPDYQENETWLIQNKVWQKIIFVQESKVFLNNCNLRSHLIRWLKLTNQGIINLSLVFSNTCSAITATLPSAFFTSKLSFS